MKGNKHSLKIITGYVLMGYIVYWRKGQKSKTITWEFVRL